MSAGTSEWVRSALCRDPDPCCVELRRRGDVIDFCDSKNLPDLGGLVLSFSPSQVKLFFDQIERGRRLGFGGAIQVRCLHGRYRLFDSKDSKAYLLFTWAEMDAFYAGVKAFEFDHLLHSHADPELVSM